MLLLEPLSRSEITRLIDTQVLPRVESGAVTLVPAHPLRAARVVRVTPQEAPLLRTPRRGRGFTLAAHWVEEGFNAARFPTFVWVVEGEADFRLGVTRRMAAHDKKLPSKNGIYVVTLPAHSFFLVPPGTPFSDASRPHWERPHLQDAHCRLLWFHILPAGVSLHTCTTRGEEHTTSRALFLSEMRLLPLAEALLEETQTPNAHSDRLVRHGLAMLLLHIDRALATHRAPSEEEDAAPSYSPLDVSGDTPVQRACGYIEKHLREKIVLRQVAAAAYISPSHLNRLFRAVLGETINEYITRRRLEQARSLLETTDLPIGRVGALCGYLHPQQFSRVFAHQHGFSPGEFRRRSRAL
jgi:AraC-like DNA-binding protein